MAGPGTTRFRSLSPGRKVLLTALVLGLVLGLLVAPFAYEATVDPRPDRIAVVPIVGVLEAQNTQDVIQRLEQARQDPSVEAVVIVVNSPGGFAVDGEEVFMAVERTAQKKPVVASVGLQAASAGYKATLPADEIYAKPASSVGSVGSILVRPEPVPPIEVMIETGPQKVDGQTPRGWEHGSEMIGGTFADTVIDYRGDQLQLSREELAHARIYTGIEGVELGLIDGISDTQGAIQAAADLAGLQGFEVSMMEYETEVRFLDRAAYTASTQPNKSMVSIEELVDTDGNEVVPTQLMLPAAAFGKLAEAEEAEGATENVTDAETRGENSED